MSTSDAFATGSEGFCGMLEGGYEVAVRFNALSPFSQIIFSAPNLGKTNVSVTLSLYKMGDGYDKTRASQPVCEKRFCLADGFMLALDTPCTEAGEYLFVAHDGQFGVGFCGYVGSREDIGFYLNGVECSGGMEVRVVFDGDGGFGELSSQPGNTAPADNVEQVHPLPKNVPFMAFSGIDGLGRNMALRRKPRSDIERQVGMFFWDWSYNFCDSRGINLQELTTEYPDAKNDYDHPIWKDNEAQVYHWNEPIYGFYNCCDGYVVRRQAQALADAGVDFIVLDCTNGAFVWKEGYDALTKGFDEARRDGVNVPKIVFMLNFAPFRSTWIMARQIYTDIYRKGLYKDLWYYRDGKPLLICHRECFDPNDPLDREILEFFSFRTNDPLYFTKTPERDDSWGWLSVYPQPCYGKKDSVRPELMTVSVAQNASEHGLVPMNDHRGGVFGRSYTKTENYKYAYIRDGKAYVAKRRKKGTELYGLNFDEQFKYAIQYDPEIIFITGYNEWVAGRHRIWQDSPNAFPDEYNDEYSRDIEPTKGDLKDHYYCQLATLIRAYKGIAPFKKSAKKTISSYADWADVEAVEYYNNTAPKRDHSGYAGCHYTDDSSRNTVVVMKSCYDDENVYFLAECEKDITEFSDAWMNLYIRTDTAKPHWESFNFVINRIAPGSVERSKGGFEWVHISNASVSVGGNAIMLAVSRKDLELDGRVELDYKWADNTCRTGDILEFYTTGCVAPGERFTVSLHQ